MNPADIEYLEAMVRERLDVGLLQAQLDVAKTLLQRLVAERDAWPEPCAIQLIKDAETFLKSCE